MAINTNLYNNTSFACSKLITNKYSTSFSHGIHAFDKRYRDAIYAIYGFVRYADEIVDTFHEHDKQGLIAGFRRDTFAAIDAGISLNPVLQSFQLVVNEYGIERELTDAFLCSMEMDLDRNTYNTSSFKAYIYGSAEVVGLMCLRVFTDGDERRYQSLLPNARSLGSAFQKINFLRDVKADFEERGRTYFPGVDLANFAEKKKKQIEADIKTDFDDALAGIKQLPKGTRLGVYIAYLYYLALFKKIKATSACTIMQQRVRIPGVQKMVLYARAVVAFKLGVL
ncbi:phytoene/squalene synthase family protein [Mucilaginibacter sp. HMF5004]|uniref:phytoene/squalene synthase family protein n=1 Tax=Mucilaginibacter rivuli TaxID=2857527 RepID=UPI001C5D4DC5|nr:phytoene/squalene synthase family protein [Mucilaginibacter rivuli]MBW4891782.1 phytoene/squalene synthase family protein [Mucilaginibacter rivuli]